VVLNEQRLSDLTGRWGRRSVHVTLKTASAEPGRCSFLSGSAEEAVRICLFLHGRAADLSSRRLQRSMKALAVAQGWALSLKKLGPSLYGPGRWPRHRRRWCAFQAAHRCDGPGTVHVVHHQRAKATATPRPQPGGPIHAPVRRFESQKRQGLPSSKPKPPSYSKGVSAQTLVKLCEARPTVVGSRPAMATGTGLDLLEKALAKPVLRRRQSPSSMP